MAGEVSPMICPSCGVAMNHHAEKLVHPTGPADAACMDPVLGGMVEELHTCPACGTGASRRASSGSA
jgi:ribosomal protein S27AE